MFIRSRGSRRAFLGGSAALAAAGTVGMTLAPTPLRAAQEGGRPQQATAGDVAILKFLAAAELVEDDLWQQYCELATRNPDYKAALETIDDSLPRYICDDRDDERSHAMFINAYLESIGEEPVNLDPFRTLPSSTAAGALRTGRLTNLRSLDVDTSWYNRYRSRGNPDFGDTFAQVVTIRDRATIPFSRDLTQLQIQLIAHTALFHFGMIEQGGGSLYANLITNVESIDASIILASIGPVEVYHFSAFHKSLEDLYGISGVPMPGQPVLRFPNLKGNPNRAQAIFPEPCIFFDEGFPLCSVIRPILVENAGAVASATALVESQLFSGQPAAFFEAVVALATAADAAGEGA